MFQISLKHDNLCAGGHAYTKVLSLLCINSFHQHRGGVQHSTLPLRGRISPGSSALLFIIPSYHHRRDCCLTRSLGSPVPLEDRTQRDYPKVEAFSDNGFNSCVKKNGLSKIIKNSTKYNKIIQKYNK